MANKPTRRILNFKKGNFETGMFELGPILTRLTESIIMFLSFRYLIIYHLSNLKDLIHLVLFQNKTETKVIKNNNNEATPNNSKSSIVDYTSFRYLKHTDKNTPFS